MLRVESLTKHYGSFRGVDRISFSLDKGSTLGLLGPNGAGKSTVIRMLAGTLMPSEGRVMMTGTQAEPFMPEYQRQLGYLPETAPLYAQMTVGSYLRFVARIKGVPKKKLKQGLEQVLAECRLEDVAGRVIGRLSKGFRQRVGLAQALINRPALLILDEPTSGLDPGQTGAFRELIGSMQGQRTVLLSTHLLTEVRSLCSHVIIINHGKIAAQGEMDGLLGQGSSGRRFYLEIGGPDQLVLTALQGLQGVTSVTLSRQTGQGQFSYLLTADSAADPRDHLLELLAGSGWKLLELRPDRQELETLFINAITGSLEDENIQRPV